MPKNNLITPNKVSDKTTQFKTLEMETFKAVCIRNIVKAGQPFSKSTNAIYNGPGTSL